MINRDKSQQRVAASPALSAATGEQREPPHLAPKAPRETTRLAFLPRSGFIIQSLAHSIFLCIPQSAVTEIYNIYIVFIKTLTQENRETYSNIQQLLVWKHWAHLFTLKLFPNIAMLPQTQNAARLSLLLRPPQTYLLRSTT